MSISQSEAARLLWCPGLEKQKGRPNGTVHEWITKSNFSPKASEKEIILQGVDNNSFLTALASDINRLSSAASETLKNIAEVSKIPKSLGWPYVKLYYAALFYAHAVLRIWGKSPSYLRTLELIRIKDAYAAYEVPLPFKLNSNQYLIEAKPQTTEVVIIRSSDGGSHEAVWREFYNSLMNLKVKISESQFLKKDKDKLNEGLTDFISLISDNEANISWPSQMRNNIQYRQNYGTWYPYHGRSKTSNFLSEVNRVTSDAASFSSFTHIPGDDITNFKHACLAIIVYSKGVIADLHRIGGVDNFLKYGPSRFENATA
ncbi:hypothetical protein PbB2_02281 [Candidatus Phycosocius bacilliformis]|uniref:Uncharacterized protein n=1 Tax=Candidatus Phycosocius bacilliformis TaxID=1445552 RepID=A0A2P2EC10_9PROT|nr:hypothetical protein [Candidatus Phycosocius bacilliformis]GBF58595.1 hypothetical protein PbB2_02281 [Candidatus Phycosocius bacilliformis]